MVIMAINSLRFTTINKIVVIMVIRSLHFTNIKYLDLGIDSTQMAVENFVSFDPFFFYKICIYSIIHCLFNKKYFLNVILLFLLSLNDYI